MLFALAAISVAMMVLAAVHGPNTKGNSLVLRDDAVEILHGEMKVAIEEKVIARVAACSAVIDDSLRFLTPPTTTERPSMPGFSRSCRLFYLWKRLAGCCCA